MTKAVCKTCETLVAPGSQIPCYNDGDCHPDCGVIGPCEVTEAETFDDYRKTLAPQWSESVPEQLEFNFSDPWPDSDPYYSETVINEIAEVASKITSDGGSTSYYELPGDASELNDLIEHKDMPFARGNIFKACYRMGEKSNTDALYDINKIIFFAERMRGALLRGQAI